MSGIPYFSFAKGSRGFIAGTCGHRHESIEDAFQCPAVPDADYAPSAFAGQHFDRIIDHTKQSVKELTSMGGGRWSMAATDYGRQRYGLVFEG